MLVVVSDEVDGEAQMTKTPRPANSVQVGLSISREVKVDDDVDGKNVNSSRKNVSADEASGLTVLVVVVDSRKLKINN